MAPVVVLIGPPGAGKSVVGRALAELLGTSFADTDDDVEREAGVSISDIFIDQGEAAFRAMEAAAVARALESRDGVLSLGGGAVLDPVTRDRLRGQRVVFLDVGIKDAASRIGFNRDRPLLLGNPRAQWVRLMEVRRPIYTELATMTVLTDGLAPDEVAAQVAAKLREVPA
jgi:shikimate kinase